MTVHNQPDKDDTESLLQQVQALESELRGVVKTQIQLAGLETRRAGESLVRMVAFGIVAGLLLFSAWAALVAAAVIAVMNSSALSLTTLLIIIAAGHLALAFYIVKSIKQSSRDLLFDKTSSNF